MENLPNYFIPKDSFVALISQGMRINYPGFNFYRGFSDCYVMECLKCKKRDNLHYKEFHENNLSFNQKMIDIVIEKHKDCFKKK